MSLAIKVAAGHWPPGRCLPAEATAPGRPSLAPGRPWGWTAPAGKAPPQGRALMLRALAGQGADAASGPGHPLEFRRHSGSQRECAYW